MNQFQRAAAIVANAAEADAARRADPLFEDVKFLRSRDFRVTGEGDAWRVDGAPFDAAALRRKASDVRARLARLRAVNTPPPPKPVPVVSAMEAWMEGRMPNGVLRGKTEREVKDDLEACRDICGGWGALAKLTGAGKSTLANASYGLARIGESVMTALYGAEGGHMRPELQALFDAADVAPEIPDDTLESGPSVEVEQSADVGSPEGAPHSAPMPPADEGAGGDELVRQLRAMAMVVQRQLEAADARRRAALAEAERARADALDAEVRLYALNDAIDAFGGEVVK